MPLADYFSRDKIAISQILQGFQEDAFAARLEGIAVETKFGAEAAQSRDGRDLLDLLVRLLARLYPILVFSPQPGAEGLAVELAALAKAINPNIEIPGSGRRTDASLAVGSDAGDESATNIFVGCDGWSARVGTGGPYEVAETGNPFGAGFAACLAAAGLFRLLFMPGGSRLVDIDVLFPDDADEFPTLQEAQVDAASVLVGVGAIGNGAAWALARIPFAGRIYLVDPEKTDLSNLQRYVLCERHHETGPKAVIAGSKFQKSLKAIPYHGTWDSFLGRYGYEWERVLVALDTERDRCAVQASLPRWIANGWTQLGDLGVSTHDFLGNGACLACLYLPTEEVKGEDQIMAEGMKIPELQMQVRDLLWSGEGVDTKMCNAVATAWGVSPDKLRPYLGLPIRELWGRGICGGGIIPLGNKGPERRELHVPLAFQSTLAGVLLAAEFARDVLMAGDGGQRQTNVRRIDLLQPLGITAPRPALKAGIGTCICEDEDFRSVYAAKYGITL